MGKRITCEDAVLALKKRQLSTPAYCLCEVLDADSRAVATALRAAVKDGRVTISYRKGRGYYRFVRLSPRKTP